MTKPVLILNGPNLNMLGTREPEIYGSETLEDIKILCEKTAKELGVNVDFRQSNLEGELVSWIQEARNTHSGIIINAAAFTHTSVAIRDALISYPQPIIEIHLSNVFAREEFRHHSFISDIAKGVICGFGSQSYTLALRAMHNLI